MRSCTSPWLWLTDGNNAPQTGMSRLPCAETSLSPLIVLNTFSSGKVPPFFAESSVKLAGAFFSAAAAGPVPLPSNPWQAAQYCLNISDPDAADVGVTGTFLIVGCAFAAMQTNRTNAIVNNVTTLDAMRVSFFEAHQRAPTRTVGGCPAQKRPLVCLFVRFTSVQPDCHAFKQTKHGELAVLGRYAGCSPSIAGCGGPNHP